MNIELVDSKLVKITWPPYDASIETEIVNRLAQVPGIEGKGRRWYAPSVQTARLMELFPKASYQYAAIATGDAIARTFYTNLVLSGIELKIVESGAIVGFGESVSPLLQQLIDDRAPALRSLVAEGMGKPKEKPKKSVLASVFEMPADLLPLAKGIENAKRKAEEQFQYGKRRHKSKSGQMGMGI